MASARNKFFEERSNGEKKRKDGPPTQSICLTGTGTLSDFDRRVLLLRKGIAEARDLLSKSKSSLVVGDEELSGVETTAVRSSMTIDPGVSLCPSRPISGPLPPAAGERKRSIGTSTDPCLVVPCPPLTFSILSLTLAEFLSPTFTLPEREKESREEWSEGRVRRAQDYYDHLALPSYSYNTTYQPPITFSKVLQEDIQSTDITDFSEGGEDGDDEDEGTCCGGGEKYEVLSWTCSVSRLGSPLTSSCSTLGNEITAFPSGRTQSMLNLGGVGEKRLHPSSGGSNTTYNEEKARSMEILLQDSKHPHPLRAPENELMNRGTETRQPSEHELRIQKSLGKLDVPDWYRKYTGTGPPTTPGRKECGKGGLGLAGGWSGLSSSKTSSLTSLHSTGRYSGTGRLTSSRLLATGTNSAGGRCGESLRSPNSTASVSPTPYYERSSFTYGLPYGMSRFGTARMSCGASPASLSPSPSPVAGIGSGTATSTPTASGPPSRHNSFSKQPYLGWRSQERLASKSNYRSPSERLAADLLKTQTHKPGRTGGRESEKSSLGSLEISPRKETASDLSLNNSEESNSHKLNRVRSSIKEVSNAIVDYVNENRPLDEGLNGRASPRRGFVWLESSFVGTKPIDSPTTPDTPNLLLPRKQVEGKKTGSRVGDDPKLSQHQQPPSNAALQQESLFTRNDQMEERTSNSSSVSSPTLDDILDSLLALRRPHKKFRPSDKGVGHPPPRSSTTSTPVCPSKAPGSSSGTCSPARVIGRIESSFLTNPSVSASVGIGMGLIATSQGQEEVEPKLSRESPSPLPDWDRRIDDSAPFIFPPSAPDLFGREHVNDEPHLSIPVDPTRAFNISPETNLRSEEEEGDVLKGNSFSVSQLASAGIKAHLMGGTESSLPSSPAKHRRVSFDLDLEDKEEKSSSRSRKDSDSMGGSLIVCRNSKCGKSGVGLEARREFKTCHNCNAYYCSRDCRRAHWEKHKKVCMQSRVGALCKQIIAQIRDDPDIVTHLSRHSRMGYLAKGRGCIKLFFSSPDRAERFLTGGFPDLPEPWYIGGGDILPEEMGGGVYGELSEQIQSYNTETRFVLYVSLCVVNEVPTSGAVKWEREMISRSAKVRLLLPTRVEEESPHHQVAPQLHHLGTKLHASAHPPSHDSPLVDESDEETIILQSVPIPTSRQLSPSEERRMRELSFTNIQVHLTERGIDLRRTYPDIYSRLSAYVDKEDPFLPVTIHPRNPVTGKTFRVIIMPEWRGGSAESELSGGTNQIIDISIPHSPNINQRSKRS